MWAEEPPPQGKQAHGAGVGGPVPVSVAVIMSLAMVSAVFDGMGLGVHPCGVLTVSGPVILGHGEGSGDTE